MTSPLFHARIPLLDCCNRVVNLLPAEEPAKLAHEYEFALPKHPDRQIYAETPLGFSRGESQCRSTCLFHQWPNETGRMGISGVSVGKGLAGQVQPPP
jgi:hypothetical protein